MLGIDIVDLNDPKLKERGPRSLKLIQHSQDQLIEDSNLFWILWAAKEAVFKCHREAINFSPSSIPIILKKMDDQIGFESDSFSGKVEITKDYILAICSDNLNAVEYQIIESDSVMLGDSTRNEIQEFFKSKNSQFEIGSDDLNLPVILPSKEPISISHHGRFGAFLFPTTLTN